VDFQYDGSFLGFCTGRGGEGAAFPSRLKEKIAQGKAMRKMIHRRGGTTLLEWIVVIVMVLGILGGIIASVMLAAQGKLVLIQGAMH
jgi:hypothetical protein